MNDPDFHNLAEKIRKSDPQKREEWVKRQTPLLASLDARDAEDDSNPVQIHRTPQTLS